MSSRVVGLGFLCFNELLEEEGFFYLKMRIALMGLRQKKYVCHD